MIKKGEELKLEIEKFIFEGKGIGRIDVAAMPELEEYKDFKVLVPHAYPGDVITAIVRKSKKNYAEAELKEILRASPYRVAPRCKYYLSCGGCKQQDLLYSQQTIIKQQQVEEIFHHTGGYIEVPVEPIIACEREFFYRNKMEYSFSENGWLPRHEFQKDAIFERKPALGLHVPQGFDRVIHIDECFLQSELSNTILQKTAEFFFSKGTGIYSHKQEGGYLRNLVIRHASLLPQLMVNLVTAYRDDELMKEYTSYITGLVPEITTVVNNINTRRAMVAQGEYEIVDFGSGFMLDKIGQYQFRVSANAFFQTNTIQAELLYATAAEFAGLTGNETVYDLYCGAGTISIFVSKNAGHVYGFELVEQAINDANVNKELNGITNTSFMVADLYNSVLPAVQAHSIPAPDVLIADPPRSGMHKNTIQDILTLAPQKIVYVSCNPATQVRDIQDLTAAGYTLTRIKPVDMFPHTFHIENVALLEKTR